MDKGQGWTDHGEINTMTFKLKRDVMFNFIIKNK